MTPPQQQGGGSQSGPVVRPKRFKASNRSNSGPDASFQAASPAVVRVEVRDSSLRLTGQGLGFFVSNDSLIGTNDYVIYTVAVSEHCVRKLHGDGPASP